jgi:DNA-binding NarL/FixJ family response regulator
MSPVRVALADDHPLLRSGLRQALAAEPDVVVIGEAATSEEALALGLSPECDVLVLDLAMPGAGGLSVIRVLHERRPALRVIVLSAQRDAAIARAALRAGAGGYLTKDASGAQILEAIRRTHAGHTAISDDIAEQLIRDGGDPPPHERLSEREREVLRLLARGRTVSDIAHELSLSIKTVSTYRTRMLQKLGVETTGELIRYALERRLFPD